MENNAIRAYGTYEEITNKDPSLTEEWRLLTDNENSNELPLRCIFSYIHINSNKILSIFIFV